MSGEGRPGRLLGVDVGERRIGIAVSEGRIAVPLTIIEHTNRAEDIRRIDEIARREEAGAIVVGLPVSLSGEEHEQARVTRVFGDQLAKVIDVPVLYHDERYSSVRAEAAIDEQGAAAQGRRASTKRPRKRHIDDRAAALMLQSYLDEQERAS